MKKPILASLIISLIVLGSIITVVAWMLLMPPTSEKEPSNKCFHNSTLKYFSYIGHKVSNEIQRWSTDRVLFAETNITLNTSNSCFNLYRIDFRGRNLKYFPHDIFNGLKHLISLNLDSNELTDLDSNIFNGLSHLMLLEISYNNLTSLPRDIFDGLNNLRTLFLKSNKLTVLEPNIFDGLLKLYTLDISNNSLQSLPAKILSKNTELSQLCLQSNKLNIIDPTIFADLNSLSMLNIDYNPFNDTESLEELILKSFKRNNYPEFVDVIRNDTCRNKFGYIIY